MQSHGERRREVSYVLNMDVMVVVDASDVNLKIRCR